MIIAAVVVVPGGAVVRTRIWSVVVMAVASAVLVTTAPTPASAGIVHGSAQGEFDPAGPWSGVAVVDDLQVQPGMVTHWRSGYALEPVGDPDEWDAGPQPAVFYSQATRTTECVPAGSAVEAVEGGGGGVFSISAFEDGYNFSVGPVETIGGTSTSCTGDVSPIAGWGPYHAVMPQPYFNGPIADTPVPSDPTALRGSASGEAVTGTLTETQTVMWRFTTRPDGDGDGRPDDEDCQPGVVNDPGEGCQTASDEDGDGVGDDVDACPGTPPGTEVDAFGCRDALRLVALGDSYSSGEGAYEYDPATDDLGVNHCHRSERAYSRVAVDIVNGSSDGEGHTSLACSGATAVNLTDEGFCGSGCGDDGVLESPQLEALQEIVSSEAAPIDVVTVGIGGNDAGFADVVTGCMVGTNCVRNFDPLIEGRPPGAPTDVAIARVADVLDRVHQIVGDQTRVILVGYPVFISAAYEACPGAAGFSPLGDDEAEWMRGQILAFNRDLDNIVQSRPWAEFLDLDSVYGENVLCNGGVADSWVNAIKLNDPPTNTCISNLLGICNESFHPTADGHQAAGEALARCILNRSACGSASNETVRPPWVLGDLRCDGLPVTVVLSAGHQPSAGRDVIWGTKRGDVINAGAGGDRVCGRGGGDTVTGGDGADVIEGGGGANVLRGGAGRDLLVGGDERDELSGGDGDDSVSGGNGDDVVDGDAGADRLYAGFGRDQVRGGSGNDTLDGGNGRDSCDGGAGSDRAFACETRRSIP